ncbi:5-hydroxytryptamine receptor 1A-like [Saccoglossus kowalevskii]|uniref:Muscarinic acetylcholine receptor M3-like n=1 Tax=Saccoglossus kowalevskii TaxID=10224 RepID=A0ABM0MDI3_SACKO|nr:PREDICTED: muscarinic acetylcholine receptor M3-like [Saccoglossus kowalevskii]
MIAIRVNSTNTTDTSTTFNLTTQLLTTLFASTTRAYHQQSTTLDNSTEYDEEEGNNSSKLTLVLLGLLFSLFIIVTIVANLLILVAFGTHEKLRHRPTNHFYASLAISDLAAGLLVHPLAAYDSLLDMYGWQLGKVCCIAWLSIDYFVYNSSIYCMCAICLDRYLCIVHAVYYRNRRSTKIVRNMNIVAWVLGFIVSVPAMVLWDTLVGYSIIDYGTECFEEWMDNMPYVIANMVLTSILPFLIISLLYLRIYIAVKEGSKSKAQQTYSYTERGNGETFEFSRRGETCGPTTTARGVGTNPNSSGETRLREITGIHPDDSLGKQSSIPRDGSENVHTSNTTLNHIGGDNLAFVIDDNLDSISPNNYVNKDTLLINMDVDKRLSNNTVGNIKTSVDNEIDKLAVATVSPKYNEKSRVCSKRSRDRRAAKVLGLLVGFFLLSNMPLTIAMIWDSFCTSVCLPSTLLSIAYWLQYSNSIVNPFLYVYNDKEFRNAVVRVVMRTLYYCRL